jgi:hypothetical protein
MTAPTLLMAAPLPAQAPAPPGEIRHGLALAESCALLPPADACAIIDAAARMLKPTYEKRKATDGKAALGKMGYDVTYVPASRGFLQGTTDVFLASKPGSNRLFIVITGTESMRDWYENAKFGSYTAVYKDGQFYIPPGHAGFRRGMLNIVNDHVLALDEYDDGAPACPPKGTRPRRSASISALTLHLCEFNLSRDPGSVETVIVGHSRGAGIGMVTATAFAGLEIRRPLKDGPATVARQAFWPLRLHAIVAFSPPHAVYHRSDRAAGLEVPDGILDQWKYIDRLELPERTVAFLDDRDIVPHLSTGVARNFGHRYRIRRGGSVVYDGTDWEPDVDVRQAHSSRGYCRHVLGLVEDAAGVCPDSEEPLGNKRRRGGERAPDASSTPDPAAN